MRFRNGCGLDTSRRNGIPCVWHIRLRNKAAGQQAGCAFETDSAIRVFKVDGIGLVFGFRQIPFSVTVDPVQFSVAAVIIFCDVVAERADVIEIVSSSRQDVSIVFASSNIILCIIAAAPPRRTIPEYIIVRCFGVSFWT